MFEELKSFIRKSFDDRKFSRAESKAFYQLLQEAQLTRSQLDQLRLYTLELAQTQIKDKKGREVLEWLGDLWKVWDRSLYKKTENLYKTLFFPSEESLGELLKTLSKTEKTLDICVFTITDNRITDTILSLKDRGVSVRIITDDEKSDDTGSDIQKLKEAGIPVRFDNSPSHMHHKFAIIDGEILINGSFNWTRSASRANQENLIITDQKKLVEPFQREFQKLWEKFSNNT